MLAHEGVRKFQLRSIGADVLIYGIVSEGTSAASKKLKELGLTQAVAGDYLQSCSKGVPFVGVEIPDSETVDMALKKANDVSDEANSPLVEPEHILYALITYTYDPCPILAHVRLDISAVRRELHELIWGAGSEPCAQPVKPAAPHKPKRTSIRDWFAEDAIAALSSAEEDVKAYGGNEITTDDLARVLMPMCSWFPKERIEQYTVSSRERCAPTVNLSLAISSEANDLFIRSRDLSRTLGLDKIDAGCLLVALFGYEDVKNAYWHHTFGSSPQLLSGMVSLKTVECDEEPLMENEHCVRATRRFVRMLKAAFRIAVMNGHSYPDVQSLVLALVEEARISEVAFVDNRSADVAEAERDVERMKHASTTSPETIKRILQSSAEHARRLNSRLLDINHIAIALLAENDESVHRLMEAFGEPRSRATALQRRLESCVLQATHGFHLIEPGVLIDLYEPDILPDVEFE